MIDLANNYQNSLPQQNQKQCKTKFTFIDLFAGIGGIRLAFESVGGKCVFSSEWDKYAQKTYQANFGEIPAGDITKIDEKDIPKFDILCAGFPCQPFSIAGKRKGFEDTRGTLFFDIARIVKYHKPKVVFLENVKNLLTHNKGETFKVIKETLEELGYVVYYKVLNAKDFGVPQNRERIYIVCFNNNFNNGNFEFPEKNSKLNIIYNIREILFDMVDDKYYYSKFNLYNKIKDFVKFGKIYQWRRIYLRENKNNLCPTLTANMGTGGHNVPIIRDLKDIRKLTPKECFKFQGFPDNYILPSDLSDSHLYKQIGNSVVVPIIEKIAINITKLL